MPEQVSLFWRQLATFRPFVHERRNTELNPRPQSEPDSNALALRAWIRQFGQVLPQNPGYFRQIRWFNSSFSLYSPIAQSLNA